MPIIEELLQRRNDLSTFLVHFTRDYDGVPAKNNLLSILRGTRIDARNCFGMAQQLAGAFDEVAHTQRCVCFTETPLEHAWMMCEDISGRRVQFSGYGLAFTKSFARRKGVNPVWYLDITKGHDWLTEPVRQLIQDACRAAYAHGPKLAEKLAAADILRLTPFIEQMGMPANVRKEFWWEREWRRVGSMLFDLADVVVVLAPEHEHEDIHDNLREFAELGKRMPPLVDARWGLERVIAQLSGANDDGPFPLARTNWHGDHRPNSSGLSKNQNSNRPVQHVSGRLFGQGRRPPGSEDVLADE